MAEWQIWGSSRIAHVVTGTPTKRSGVKTECGVYVGRGIGAPFFALDVREPGAERAIRSYDARVCPPCRDWARPYSSDSTDPCPEWHCPDLSSEDRREGRTCPEHPCTCSTDPSFCPPLGPGENETCTHTPTCPTGSTDP